MHKINSNTPYLSLGGDNNSKISFSWSNLRSYDATLASARPSLPPTTLSDPYTFIHMAGQPTVPEIFSTAKNASLRLAAKTSITASINFSTTESFERISDLAANILRDFLRDGHSTLASKLSPRDPLYKLQPT